MGKKSYEYIDPDSLYTYKNSNVLINKQGITDPVKAARQEDILKIHHFIFQDSYDWAGNYRQVNISKSGNAFLPIQSFKSEETYLNSLIDDFYKHAHTRKEIVSHLAKILDNLNYFHPFREGNGRTQREAIRALALAKGYICQITPESNAETYHLYMDGTVYGDIQTIEKLISKVLKKI